MFIIKSTSSFFLIKISAKKDSKPGMLIGIYEMGACPGYLKNVS
jgi:hypothetical protein